MSKPIPQTYQNHVRWIPMFHFVVAPIFLLNFIWALYRMATGFSAESAITVLVALGLIFTFFFSRVFALAAQDRVIRLEERLRMATLLPDDLKPRINDFSSGQLVALRFASDAELADLARKVIEENIEHQKQIKECIKTWKPDYQRV